jgi:hypothetical protein
MSDNFLRSKTMITFPINAAETMVEPFFDPELSGLAQWTVAPGSAHGLNVRQNWCWVAFEWARLPSDGPALSMTRMRCDLACSGYDRLLVSAVLPEGTLLRVCVGTDKGDRLASFSPAEKPNKEYAVDLQGAARIESLTLELEAANAGPATGWLNWIALQNTAVLPYHLAQFARVPGDWARHLKPADYQPAFEPVYGVAMRSEELNAIRAEDLAWLQAGRESQFRSIARQARDAQPETLIAESLNYDRRYSRDRESLELLRPGPSAIMLAAVVLKDADLLRLGGRYALALATTPVWDWGTISRLRGSAFDVRVFTNSGAACELAFALDVGGDVFTAAGKELLMRRIAEDGIGAINYNAWKYEYIHHCNQLPAFSAGRILGYAVLARDWPRVTPYQDLAFRELTDSLSETILPDGGYVEGPGYLMYAVAQGGLGLFYHARSLNVPFSECMPERFKALGAFAAALMSSDEHADVIPICDSGHDADLRASALLAAGLPDSHWVTIHRKALARAAGEVPVLARQLEAAIPEQGPEPSVFVRLPAMGPLVSQRRLGGEWVKLFIQGNQAGAGHTHEDKGSFVLEFAGETFALDPGTCDYSHPLANILHNCERHNMLVPYGMPERPHPACPLPHDVKPDGAGDATAFHAEIDATPGWEGYFRRWRRTWDSPTPDVLTVTDDYELAAGDGVEFYWQTRLPATVDGNRAVITGARGRVELEAPAGCEWRVDELPLLGGVQRRLALRLPGPRGDVIVRVRLVNTRKSLRA